MNTHHYVPEDDFDYPDETDYNDFPDDRVEKGEDTDFPPSLDDFNS